MTGGQRSDIAENDGSGLSALKISVIYLLFGTGALVLFDVVVPEVVHSESLLTRVQTLKGGIEVIATALLVYVLVDRSRLSLSKTNERLEESRIRLTVLYRVLRYNLRTEMTLIRGYAERAHNEATDTGAREASGEAVAAVDSVSRWVDKIHSFRNVVHQRTSRIDVPLNEVVDSSVTRAAARVDQEAAISVGDFGGLVVRAVPEIEHAITELIENAILHQKGNPPTVEIIADRRGSTIVLEITDEGPGIPAQEVAVIADHKDETTLEHASGVGLWLAEWTVAESGGEMTITDRDPRGTAVGLSLPAAD